MSHHHDFSLLENSPSTIFSIPPGISSSRMGYLLLNFLHLDFVRMAPGVLVILQAKFQPALFFHQLTAWTRFFLLVLNSSASTVHSTSIFFFLLRWYNLLRLIHNSHSVAISSNHQCTKDRLICPSLLSTHSSVTFTNVEEKESTSSATFNLLNTY